MARSTRLSKSISAGLLAMPQIDQTCDVHCVTKWSVFDSHWTGVRVADLAARAGVKKTARYVVFESAHGYTSNLPLHEALRPNVLVAHRHEGSRRRTHGAPVRALVPDSYFWRARSGSPEFNSAKPTNRVIGRRAGTTTTQIHGKRNAIPEKLKIRPWVRAIHRDLGYVAVGLTFVYAISGLAVNHVADWDSELREPHANV